MNKMLRYLSDYKRESVLAPLFKMLEATFDLFVPLVMADIVNVGIAAHDFHYILVRCGILLLLAIVGLACSLTAQYFSAKAAVGYSTGLRHALFEHIQTLSFSEMDTMGTSTLITRMTSDVNQVQSGLNLFLRLFLRGQQARPLPRGKLPALLLVPLIPNLGKHLGAFLFLCLFLLLAAFFLLLHRGHNVGGNLKRANEIEIEI